MAVVVATETEAMEVIGAMVVEEIGMEVAVIGAMVVEETDMEVAVIEDTVDVVVTEVQETEAHHIKKKEEGKKKKKKRTLPTRSCKIGKQQKRQKRQQLF